MKVVCDYCGNEARMVGGLEIYPHRRDLAILKFYLCDPCDAYVGTHRNTNPPQPLGRLANAELRKAKKAAHAAFDPLWRSGRMNRHQAYKHLAQLMELPPKDAHIGMFTIEQCHRVVALIQTEQAQ